MKSVYAEYNQPDELRRTIVMPCNTSGWYDSAIPAQYGVASFDWSNARESWANSKPMDCGSRLVTQTGMVKAINPATKVWVYRNLVKALSWYEDVAEKLADPQFAGFFLPFAPQPSVNGTFFSPPCTLGTCSKLYHAQSQTPEHGTGRSECLDACDCGGIPCGEYVFGAHLAVHM